MSVTGTATKQSAPNRGVRREPSEFYIVPLRRSSHHQHRWPLDVMSQLRRIKDMKTTSSSSSAMSTPTAVQHTKSALAKSTIAAAAAASASQGTNNNMKMVGGGGGGKATNGGSPARSATILGSALATAKSIGNVTPQKKQVTLVDKDEELVASSPSERNWRGILIALLVIIAVLGLIIFSIFLLSPEDEGARVRGQRIQLSDVLSDVYKYKPFNGSWINDGELVYRDNFGGLSILSVDSYSTKVLMTNSTFRQLNADQWLVSPDLRFVLLLSDSSDEGSRYSVYEVQTRNTFPLSPFDNAQKTPLLQHVVWGPSSAAHPKWTAPTNGASTRPGSQAIAFVHDNDLYYKPKVQNDLVCRITTTGLEGSIYNGIPDWFYSNIPELKSETLAFSSDGRYLSFMSFNDTEVDQYDYTWLGDSWKYPKIRSIRYPKEGSSNPNVTVFVVDLSVLKFINRIQIKPPPEYVTNNSYVGAMKWLSAVDLSVNFMNRAQTNVVTLICRAPSFVCRAVFTESIVDNGIVLLNDRTIFSRADPGPSATTNQENESEVLTGNEFESSSGFLIKRLPVRDGKFGYYRHVVFVSTSDMRTVPLTMGRFEVTEILAWDEVNEVIYFMATPRQKPGQRQLYRINLTLNVTRTPNRVFVSASTEYCISCDNSSHSFKLVSNNASATNGSAVVDTFQSFESNEIPNNCLFNRMHFSPGYTSFIQECLGPDSPSVYLVDTQSEKKIIVLNNGDQLRNRLAGVAIPVFKSFAVEISNGYHAHVRLMLPPGWREDEDVSFPMVLQMDAAPGSQLVSEEFKVDWNWFLCSQRTMIVAQIDGRGSQFFGERTQSQVKGKLGTVDIDDQMSVLTYLRDTLKFIDPLRICAYGWGYGGYAAAMLMATDSQRVLQCALSINPIVSFAHHNTFFTDRWMPRGNDYLRQLQVADLSMRAGNIEDRNFFLVHGTADTLVHQQHSLMLARSLIDQGVGFRHQVYTDEGHELAGVLTHLYKNIEWFFNEAFGPVESNEWDPSGFFAFKQ